MKNGKSKIENEKYFDSIGLLFCTVPHLKEVPIIRDVPVKMGIPTNGSHLFTA
jgi:hypothetical protein